MPTIQTSVLKDKGLKLGDYHSWWLPHSPKDGEQWGQKERLRGAIYTESHKRSPDGKYREGGPFYTLKYRTHFEFSQSITVFRKDNYRAYKGVFGSSWDAMHDFSWMPMWNSTTENVTADMFVYGAQALARLRPDRPDFSPLLDVIETLREVPALWASFKRFNANYHAELNRLSKKGTFPSKTGKYYLAIQFGWLPLVSSFQSFFKAFEGRHKRFKQLWRDNGRWVRRRVMLHKEGPDASEPEVAGWSDLHNTPWNWTSIPLLKAECYGGGLARTENSGQSSVRIWAVGKCKYYLPALPVEHTKGMKKMKRMIYADTRITPELLYNLIPWSWFVDYFTSLGSVFDVASGGIGESIVFDYAYIMRERRTFDRVKVTQFVYVTPTTTGPITYSMLREGVLRGRIEASLFGFGITEESLSPFQWSILGALGLSRL